MFVKVTGGISRVVGALNPAAAADACVCGNSPVRTIGGWSRVEMAFWLVSRTVDPRRWMSREPPIELIEAVLPRRGWYRFEELCR